jgi:hypothetical protein
MVVTAAGAMTRLRALVEEMECASVTCAVKV